MEVAGGSCQHLLQLITRQVFRELACDRRSGGRRELRHPAHGAIWINRPPLIKKRAHGVRPFVLRKFCDPLRHARVDGRPAGFFVSEQLGVGVDDAVERGAAGFFRGKPVDESTAAAAEPRNVRRATLCRLGCTASSVACSVK